MAAQHSRYGDYSTRYKFNGKEQDEATGFYYYAARYYAPSLSTDPLAEKYQGFSPYNYTLNNPVRFVDPDGRSVEYEYDVNTKTGKVAKVSDLGGEDINFYHYYGGGSEDLDGTTRILNTETNDDQQMSSSKWIRGYTHRDQNVNLNNIVSEYFSGEGPEKSLITTDQVIKDIINSPIFKSAKKVFIDTGMKEKKLVTGEGKFGGFGAMKAKANWTAQKLGKFSVSFYPVGNKVVMTVMDSKSKNSVNPFLKIEAKRRKDSEYGNIPREKGKITPEGNTYQTYIFYLPLSDFK